MNKIYTLLALLPLLFCLPSFGQNVTLQYENENLEIQGATGTYELDLNLETDAPLTLGKGKLYFDYNAAAFGNNAVSSGNIVLTVPPTYWLAQTDNFTGSQNIYTNPKVTDAGPNSFVVTWDQVLEESCMDQIPAFGNADLFHLEMHFQPNGINETPDLCFVENAENELNTACGPFANCTLQPSDCTNSPGSEIVNITYSCTSSVFPCGGGVDEDNDGICSGEDCDDTNPNIGGVGSPCDDGNACTENDVFDEYCNCSGEYKDSDNDGVCDAFDACEGFHDSIDMNNNGIPDGCENGADPSCISFWYTPSDKAIACDATPVFDQPGGQDHCCSNPNLTFSYQDNFSGTGCNFKIERIWIGTSECGNMKTVKQTITLVDTEAPTFVIDHELFDESNDGDTLSMDCSDNLLIVPNTVTAIDNCTDDPKVEMFDEIEDGFCPNDGYVKLLYCYWVAEDNCGNRDTFDIWVTFTDTTAPEIECPDDIVIQCFESIAPSVTGEPTATDDCSSIQLTYADVVVSSTACEEILERTWYASDECQNVDSCKQIITIVDTTPPDITCPNDVTVDCDDPTDPTNTGIATAADLCGTVTISNNDQYLFLSDCEQKIERTWNAEDNCANEIECLQIITILDLTAPSISCPDNTSVECHEGANPDDTGFASGTDNCDLNLDITYSDDTTIFNIYCDYLIDRTWTLTDNCGNTDQCIQSIKVDDTTPPVIECPSDLTIECDESSAPDNTGIAVANDSCDPELTVWYEDAVETGPCTTIITRTWFSTDNCGNLGQCNQIITISDFTPPIIGCPDDKTVECDDSLEPDFTGYANANDNCDQFISVTYEDVSNTNSDCETVVTRTWTAEDDCGNQATCEQLITISDSSEPIISCPDDVVLECTDSSDPAFTGEATATDNCDPDVQISNSDEVTTFDPCTYQITRTWLATNNCGLTATCVQIVMVTDLSAPEIICPTDLTIDCDASLDPSNTGNPTGNDNCDLDLIFSFQDKLTEVSECESYITRTWIAEDNCGISTTCEQIITLIDMTPPIISCPDDTIVECDAPHEPSITGNPSIIDNCDTLLTTTYNDEISFPNECETIVTRTWTTSDDCANESSCVQTITKLDTTLPTVLCPQDITIECTDSTNVANTGEPFAFDNCDAQLDISFDDVITNPSDCETIVERTWKAVDNCGNEGDCVQKITLTDSTEPEIICPEDVVVECNTTYDPSVTGSAMGADNCDLDLVITFEDEAQPFNDCETVINRTWTATDNCGNVLNCIQQIKVTDTTLPEITCPADMTIECDAGIDPTVSGEPTVSDNCDTSLVVTFVNETNFQDPCTHIFTRTFTVEDNCANTADCSQVITISDTTTPEITCPDDLTIECATDASPYTLGFATGTDNCDQDLVISWFDEVEEPDSCTRIHYRTWKAIDNCGNVDSCMQVITVTDTSPPINQCPQNVTIQCDQSSEPGDVGEPVVFDNCDQFLDLTYQDSITAQDGCTTIIRRVWSAMDNCGNVSDCQQFITLTDSGEPNVECPADITVECNTSIAPDSTGMMTASDICDADLEITFMDNVVQLSDCESIITRFWMASDNCNNVTSCEQIITITDSTQPELICPEDITIECTQSTDPSITGFDTTTDNCDFHITVNYSDDTLFVDDCSLILGRLWTAIDDCGNQTTCAQTITVDDDENPELFCPGEVTIECNLDPSPYSQGFPTVTDNCDADISLSWQDEMIILNACETQINREWSAIDNCGNITTCTQILLIVDSTPPVNNCPPDVSVNCDVAVDTTQTGEPFAFDNCDAQLEIWYNDEVVSQDSCQTLIQRTWSAEDDCGNISPCVQFITVTDTSEPEISCPGDVTVSCSSDFSPVVTGLPTGDDNCDIGLDLQYDDQTTGDDCNQLLSRTWSVTDACGNTTSCVQLITLTDNESPSMVCPAYITINCEESTDPGSTGEATAIDNCGSPNIIFADSLDQLSPCEYDIYRTWAADDGCGNSVSCLQVVKVLDLEAPEIGCAPDVTVECDASTDPNDTGFPLFSDNCDQNLTLEYQDNTVVLNDCETAIQRNWTVTDHCGYTKSCLQIITITDSQVPEITCPGNTVLECDDITDPTMTGEASAIDNCDSDVEIYYTDDIQQVSDCEYIINRTWGGADNCGNEATCIQMITVTDQTPPEITCPDDIAVPCDGPTDPSVTGMATAWDVCDQDVQISYADQQITGPGCAGTIERTWTAIDDCGNTETCVQIISITDSGLPTINCPPALTIECDGSTDPGDTGEPFAFDNCDPTVESTYEDELIVLNACTNELNRNWKATDDCGNEAICVQVITITDLTVPTITCPADTTLECSSPIPPSVTGIPFGTDNCTSNMPFTFVDDTTSVDDCTWLVARTWTGTDDCGNEATCSQNITLVDTTNPELEFNSPTLNGLSNCDTITLECSSLDSLGTHSVIATDNCDAAPNVDFEVHSVPGDCVVNGIKETNTYTWYAQDACGNADTLKVTIIITDTTAPTITPNHPMINGAQNCDTLIIDCENFWFLGEDDVIVADNCGDVTVTFEEEIDQQDCSTNGGLISKMTCQWIAEDDCGNADTLKLVFEVIDTTAPVLMGVPSDTSYWCADIPDPAMVTATDGCTGDPEIWLSETVNPPMGGGTCELIREWTASDDCGNSVTGTQIITVLDCIGCFMPLNPYFIDFQGALVDEQSNLMWEFTAVTKPHLFTIQRSADGKSFVDIGAQDGRISFNKDSDIYYFTDEAPRTGNNFYRIRALNLADVAIFSDTILLRHLADEKASYQIYPNPTTDEVNLEFLTNLDAEVKITVNNELGQILMDENLPKETVVKVLDFKDLPAGVYFISLDFEGQRRKIERVVKLD